ncbi:MAG: LysR substrate-binding domain-containing protein [Lachnospiraceae bacterium]
MNIRQIEYILKIAEERNITRAAEKLFISQPALNKHLLLLEDELGTKIFHRSRSDWHPTEAGNVYLESAQKILQIKREAYRVLNDMVTGKMGELSIGFTPGRGSEMFSYVYPKFYSEYPDIILTPHELSVRRQQALIARGELDLGFLTLCDKHRTSDEYIPLSKEEIFLALPKKHPLSHYETDVEFATMDISAVQYEPFVLMYPESTIRLLVDDIFEQSGFDPCVLFETSSTNTILTMIRSSLCCGLIPYHYIKKRPEGIACFSLPSRPTWDIVVSYPKGCYLTQAAKFFIELAKEFYSDDIARLP